MEDDFNTADAISAIFELVKLANTTGGLRASKEYMTYMYKLLVDLTDILGIITKKEEEKPDARIEALIAERTQAKKDKDFGKADAIRERLKEMGIVLEDTREGVKWKRI